jgi:hypothetical protein
MSRLRLYITVGLLSALLCGIVACSGFWNTAPQLGTLVVGPVVVTGIDGYVLVSVTDMPSGGLAAIQFGTVGDEAITLSSIDPSSVAIDGKSGFIVLAKDFATNPGKGALLAAIASTGVTAGEVLRFTFKITGPNPVFTVTKSKVTLASDSNVIISTWNLSTKAYYTR